MAKNNRHNAAFVVGSVLGAVVGAGAALWKTPYTGAELREKLAGSGSKESGTIVARPATGATAGTGAGERSIKDKVLSGVEKTLAPIVGVELGKTANGSGNIKVNADVAQGAEAGTSTTHSAAGSDIIGLSRDRVDADKWAAAYGGAATASSTQTTQTSAPAAPAPATTAPQASNGSGTSSDVSVAHAADGSSLIGLSRDRVDAARWSAAYGGQTFGESTGSTATSPDVPTGENSGAVRESTEQTSRGADPAFKGDDGDAERHPPVDRGTPENVAPATQEDNSTRPGRDFAADAASTDQLTRPQVQRTPDSQQQPTERGLHPFPKLGGKE